MLGGFIVGVLENLLGAYVIGNELKLTFALVLIVGVLVVRPRACSAARVVRRMSMTTVPAQAPSRSAASLALVVVLLARLRAAVPGRATTARFQLTLVLVYAIALLGLNILTGYNGQISLGHGAFYAIGAYVAAIMMDQCRRALLGHVPVAGVVCFGAGFLFGFPALRLEGLYLALATFALGVAMPQTAQVQATSQPWTGGVQGIVIMKPDPPFGLPLTQDQWLYYFTLAIALRAVRARLEPAARPRRARADRDPRPPDRRRGDGRQHSRSTSRSTFGVSAMLHRRRRRARRDRGAVRRARQLHVFSVDHPPGRHRGRRPGLDSGCDLRRVCSSSSCPTSPTRSPRRRPGRSTACS